MEDDDNASSECESSDVQLGFIDSPTVADLELRMFANPVWLDWDGGKVGGLPSWLDPVNIPRSLKCRHCATQMAFLLQIYCPLDEVSAFHRCLYLFACRQASCVASGSVICLRCQLPRKNDFYPYNCEECDYSEKKDRLYWMNRRHNPNLCALCGCFADMSCAKCKQVRYCCRVHQKSHWALHKRSCGKDETEALAAATSASTIPSSTSYSTPLPLFPEYALSVSAEEFVSAQEAYQRAGLNETPANIWDGAEEREFGDEAGEDEKLTQADYSAALGNASSHDDVYDAFMSRIRRGGSSQVLRYCRWRSHMEHENENRSENRSEPLCISRFSLVPPSSSSVTVGLGGEDVLVGGEERSVISDIPQPILFHKSASAAEVSAAAVAAPEIPKALLACPHCGVPRAFEFQVLPQLLHYLQVDAKSQLVIDPYNLSTKEDDAKQSTLNPQGVIVNPAQEDIDWGTLDVYTCTASCESKGVTVGGGGNNYLEELVIVQPPVASYRSVRTTAITTS